MEKNAKILVLGNRGLVGSAIVRKLQADGFENIINESDEYKSIRKSKYKFDLREKEQVEQLFEMFKPEYVFNVAGHVGGIIANDTKSGEIISDNLLIQTNVINACHNFNIKKLLFTGSSCIYPKMSKQPIKEEYLLTGPLEETNIGYSIAKIAGLTMCDMYRKQYGDNFISVMPTNLYGPGDNFHLTNSHVLPALIRKIHEAKEEDKNMVELWGSGTPRREFLYIDDLAEATIFAMENYEEAGVINIGTGSDVSIEELANIIKDIVGFKGMIIWDASKPDGTPRKLLDVSKMEKLGWKSKTSLESGIKITYDWFLENLNNIRK